MEDANGGLSLPKGFVPVVGWKIKTAGGYERWRIGGSWQKGIGNNTTMPGFIGGLQYFERKNNRGFDEGIE